MATPLIITMGDPTGVGPEIIVKAAVAQCWEQLSRPVVVAGDLGVLLQAARVCGVEAQIQPESSHALATTDLVLGKVRLAVQPLSRLDPQKLIYGRPDAASGRAMAKYINWACDRCLTGDAAGMVTAPINKQALQLAGEPYPGHTELLAARCGIDKVIMMLAGEHLKVCLVTTHCAFSEVPKQLSQESILTTLRIVAADLQRYFGLEKPRLAVLALNPHAGEAGLFGEEEIHLIAPAIAQARAEGFDASGPHSADTLFHFAVQGKYDAVICMYHDQGLIPLKLLHFEDGVNVTLGLPIVRTSVDHGTAYDLAGTGRADFSSLSAAIRLASRMAADR